MYIYKTLERFNLLSSDKQWQVQMRMPDDKFLSELWPEDEEPDIEGVPPSEVLDLIEERLRAYLFKSGRDETLARIAAYREQAEQLDHAWAETWIRHHEQQIERMRGYLIKAEDASA